MAKIIGWDRRKCEICRRPRVHYKVGGKWHCIGTLKGVAGVTVARCGKPVLQPDEVQTAG